MTSDPQLPPIVPEPPLPEPRWGTAAWFFALGATVVLLLSAAVYLQIRSATRGERRASPSRRFGSAEPVPSTFPRSQNSRAKDRVVSAARNRDFILDPNQPFADRALMLNFLFYDGDEGLAEARALLPRLQVSSRDDMRELSLRLEAQLARRPSFRFDRFSRDRKTVCTNSQDVPGFNRGDPEEFKRSKRGDCDELLGAELSGLDLSGAWLPGARLAGAKFRGSKFAKAALTFADLSGVDFSGADLRYAQLAFTDLSEADLRDARINDRTALPIPYEEAVRRGARFEKSPESIAQAAAQAKIVKPSETGNRLVSKGGGAVCEDARGVAGLNTVDLKELRRTKNGECADLSEADLSGADLSGANLRGFSVPSHRVVHVNVAPGSSMRLHMPTPLNFQKADLAGADLSGSRVEWMSDFRGADLRGAKLVGAQFNGAYFQDADLSHADLRGARLWGSFQGADLRGADLRGADFAKSDLRNAKLKGAKADSKTLLLLSDEEARRLGVVFLP